MGRATTSTEAQAAKAEAKPIAAIATCDRFRKGAHPILRAAVLVKDGIVFTLGYESIEAIATFGRLV